MSLPSSGGGDGPSTSRARRPSPDGGDEPPRHDGRRLSVEEDDFYQQVMTADPKPPTEQPPPYRPNPSRPGLPSSSAQQQPSGVGGSGGRAKETASAGERPPSYSTDIDLEAVWEMKTEVVEAVKRSEDRQWRTVFVQLRGTSLRFYAAKKDWGWHRARELALNWSPDHPPWLRRAGLVRAYNLQHADVGIAADYKKRRNVIRLRVEADQLLIGCVEPSTLVTWLDALFAAIAIAHPLDERHFPPDQSVPRSQRSHLLRATVRHPPQRPNYPVPTPRPMGRVRAALEGYPEPTANEAVPSMGTGTATIGAPVGITVETVGDPEGVPGETGDRVPGTASPGWMRSSYSPSLSSSLMSLNPDVDFDADPWPSPELPPLPLPPSRGSQPSVSLSPFALTPNESPVTSLPDRVSSPASPLARMPLNRPVARRSSTASSSNALRPPLSGTASPLSPASSTTQGPSRFGTRSRSTSNTDNDGGYHDDGDGKWNPPHERRTTSDDLRYARLCYAILLFRSPRKSQYVLQRNTKWFVDWETGRMVRVLPPTYDEIDRLSQGAPGGGRRRGSAQSQR